MTSVSDCVLKLVPFGQQELAQFLVIVDFAVEDDPDALVLVAKRLMAAAQIDNGKPAEAEPDLPGEIKTLIVRSAMHDGIRHPFQDGPGNLGLSIEN